MLYDYNKRMVNMSDTFYCLVVGSRSFDDYNFMQQQLDYFLVNHKDIVIVSGGARGADRLAERYAKEHGYQLKIFYAKWDEYGKSAGYRRNEEMHQFISQFNKRGVVAFWDGESSGTKQNFILSSKYKNPIKIIRF